MSGKLAQYVYGTKPNVPEYMLFDGATYKIVSDQVGTPVAVLAQDGAVEEAFTLDEFGVALGHAAAQVHALPFGFAGGLSDAETGLVHSGAREYDPEVGRWLSKDPLLLEGYEANLYIYAGDDPVNQMDPSGFQGTGTGAMPGIDGGLGTGIGIAMGIIAAATRLPNPRETKCKESNDKCMQNNELVPNTPVCDEGYRTGMVWKYDCLECLSSCMMRANFINKPLSFLADAVTAGRVKAFQPWPNRPECGGDAFR